MRRGPFRAGDRVQLTDPKGRMHTITLEVGKEFHTHRGHLRHDDLIDAPDGSVVRHTSGAEYLALRPLLSDFVLSMPRGAQVVYPKDAGQIVTYADIFPGAVVVEAGVGSGALSLSLLRAVGESGRLLSFERREDFADIARANARSFFGLDHPAWTVTVGDLVEALPDAVEPGTVDRVVLDMLAPWDCLGVVGRRSPRAACSSATSPPPPSSRGSPRRPGRPAAGPSRRRGSRWCAGGTWKGSRSAPSTGCTGIPASS